MHVSYSSVQKHFFGYFSDLNNRAKVAKYDRKLLLSKLDSSRWLDTSNSISCVFIGHNDVELSTWSVTPINKVIYPGVLEISIGYSPYIGTPVIFSNTHRIS